MKLQTSLQLSAVFPVTLLLAVILLLRWRFGALSGSDSLDITFLAILALVGITTTALITSYNRRLIERMRLLSEWADSILAGNLNSKVSIPPGKDEISRLAQTLEKMLGDIKESYTNIHHEALSQKQRAELNEQRAAASQIGSKHLSEALTRLKDSQTKTVNEERLKALEQVVRGVAHDFSEALTPIMATTDLLLARPELVEHKEKLVGHIRSIRESAEQGREIIRHLAGFFHQVPVAQENVDINHAVRAAIEHVESQWKDTAGKLAGHITLRTNLQIVPAISGSEDDLQNAIASLISNAFEAMPDGGTVTVATRTASSNVLVEVNDTGKGMPEDVKIRAQEPFFTTKEVPHTGMGLTRAAGTVRSHGGDIRIESDVGIGTRITLSIPSRQATSAIPERVIGAPPSGPRQIKVIIVDDDKATREIIAFVASTNGHSVATAASGAECLTQMRTTPFDVAIVDLAMPGMRGDELANNIVRIHPLTAIVMLTGFGDIMMEEKNVPENVDILIPKPVSAKELLSILEKAPKAHWENRSKHMQAEAKASEQGQNDRDQESRKEPSFKWQG